MTLINTVYFFKFIKKYNYHYFNIIIAKIENWILILGIYLYYYKFC